jgi:hypothetical protein
VTVCISQGDIGTFKPKYSSVADSKQSSNDCIAECIENHSIVAPLKLPIEGILPLVVNRVDMYLHTLIQNLGL